MPITINYTTQDAKGAKSTTAIHLLDSETHVDVLEFASAVAQLFANMMTGGLVSVAVCYEIDISGLAGNTIQAGSDVEEGARFGWGVAGGFNASNRLGTFDESLIIAGSKEVDLTDADVAQWVGYMVDGYTATSTNVLLPVDYRAADINEIKTALENFTRSRVLRG